jgi:uncharacterized protein YdhG (YjbR/CyaY superfamily)
METKDNPKTIDEYISNFKPEVQEILQNIRMIVHELAPEATEKISYQMPTFVLNGNLVYFAAFEKHIGFYPTPSGILEFSDELAKYKSGKGSAQFPLDKTIPYDLIKKMVRFRITENQHLNK